MFLGLELSVNHPSFHGTDYRRVQHIVRGTGSHSAKTKKEPARLASPHMRNPNQAGLFSVAYSESA